MTLSRRLIPVALAALACAAPAFAKDHGDDHPGKGHGKGHGNPHAQVERDEGRPPAAAPGRGPSGDVRPGAYFNDEHRQYAHRYYEDHYGKGGRCPPGLARKNNGCMPPGQARKWAVGEPIPRGVVVYEVPRPVLLQLPPPPYGYHYARVGGDIVLVRNQNNIVIDIMLNVFG